MHKKVFTDYIEFLQFANKNIKNLSNIQIVDNMLLKYNTTSYRCTYAYDTGNLTPSAFCRELGIQKYSSFCFCFFSKLKDFEEDEKRVKLWKNGFFGGLIGLNNQIINKYLGNGEINTFYDYDINSAYLTELTNFLPSKFIKKISYEEYLKVSEYEKIPYIYFFEVSLPYWKGDFYKLILHPKARYKCFDFLQNKQKTEMIISEKRLNLIKQIYFSNDIKYKNVYVFEKHKATIYKKILVEYLKQKKIKPKSFKKNALKLYGCLGKIYNKKVKSIYFEKEAVNDKDCAMYANYEYSINWLSSPQVSMWVADSVAEKLFNIIDCNFDNILSWNTDGLTAIKPINFKIGSRGGEWKQKKINGLPLLQTPSSTHVFYYDFIKKEFIGADSMVEKNGKFFQIVDLHKTTLLKGYQTISNKYDISPFTKYNISQSLRAQLVLEKNIKVVNDVEYRNF